MTDKTKQKTKTPKTIQLSVLQFFLSLSLSTVQTMYFAALCAERAIKIIKSIIVKREGEKPTKFNGIDLNEFKRHR